MIAHVAEAGEDRGRVVLRLGSSGRLSEIALEAAMRVAQAFQSEIESVFVEDRQLFDLAALSVRARDLALGAAARARSSPARSSMTSRCSASALQRKVLATARSFEVPARTRVVRDEPVRALAMTCAESGPWNVVTLAEPFTAARCGTELSELFDAVAGTTGFVLAGPKARHTTGDVVAVVEDVERVPPMLRAAERIAASDRGRGAPAARSTTTPSASQWMEGQVRLALVQRSAIDLETIDMSRRTMRARSPRCCAAPASASSSRGFGGRFVLRRRRPGAPLRPCSRGRCSSFAEPVGDVQARH